MLQEPESDRELRILVEWIRKRGGKTSVRDFQKPNHSKCPTSESAKAQLDLLAASGLGYWEKQPSKTPGKEIELFILYSQEMPQMITADTPPENSLFLEEFRGVSGVSECLRKNSECQELTEQGKTTHSNPSDWQSILTDLQSFDDSFDPSAEVSEE